MPQPRRSTSTTTKRTNSRTNSGTSRSRTTRNSRSNGARNENTVPTQINTEDISQLEAGRTLLVQMLQEAHGAEAFAGTTLQAHIAMTPEGPYRKILERHLVETKDQAERLQQRLEELGAHQSLLSQGFGVATTAVGTAIALTKGPIDAIRGKAGEEKLLKNAKDELTTEAQEIATYDGVEAVARAIGDVKTAELAVSIREEEQKTFDLLRDQIPHLAFAMTRALAAGDSSYDPSSTAAAQAVRGLAAEAGREARELGNEARSEAKSAGRKARGEAKQAGNKAASTTKAAGKRFERAAQGPKASELPIKNYDNLSAAEITSKISGLTPTQLDKVESYERRNEARSTVLDRIDSAKSNA